MKYLIAFICFACVWAKADAILESLDQNQAAAVAPILDYLLDNQEQTLPKGTPPDDAAVKKRSPKSDSRDPEDHKSMKVQRVFNGQFAISQHDFFGEANGSIMYGIGVRPPVKYLGRFLIGASREHIELPYIDKRPEVLDARSPDNYHFADPGIRNTYFVEYDVYVRSPKGGPIMGDADFAVTLGYYRGQNIIFHRVKDSYDETTSSQFEDGIQVRVRSLPFMDQEKDKALGDFFLMAKINRHKNYTFMVGMDIMFGKRIWNKTKADK